MATSPPRPCGHPGCGRLVFGGSRCPTHQAAKDKVDAQYRARALESKYGKPAARGYDHEWRKVKDEMLRQHPTCACGQVSRMVHHVVPLKEGGARLDPSNLEPLCFVCHKARHRVA